MPTMLCCDLSSDTLRRNIPRDFEGGVKAQLCRDVDRAPLSGPVGRSFAWPLATGAQRARLSPSGPLERIVLHQHALGHMPGGGDLADHRQGQRALAMADQTGKVAGPVASCAMAASIASTGSSSSTGQRFSS
jgi:hypothetical protein